MPIQTIIDGVSKNIIQPEVNIGGIWKQVKIVNNNIDGVWRESFNNTNYKIRLYRYGVLYDTLTVEKGSSVKLPSVSTVQSDDIAHYGWAISSTATSRNYTPTATITPTSNMDLHAVYSYTAMVQTSAQAGLCGVDGKLPEYYTSFPITIDVAGTISYSAYNQQTGQIAGGAPITNTSGIVLEGTSYSGSLYQNAAITVNGTKLTGVFESSSSESLTYNVQVGDVIDANYTVKSQEASNDYGTYTIYFYPVITVGYPIIEEQTQYRASI